jgi:hypothetical protein
MIVWRCGGDFSVYLCFLASVAHGSMRDDFILFLFACVRSKGTQLCACAEVRFADVSYCTLVSTIDFCFYTHHVFV